MSADGDVQGAFPPDTGVRVGVYDGSSVLVSGVPVDCGFLSPDLGAGASVALLRWQGAWLALGSIGASAPALTSYAMGTGGSIALTTANQVITSAAVTVSPTATTRYHAIGVYDFSVTTAAATVAVGSLTLDGTNITSPLATFSAVTSAGRASVTQQWFGTLAPGSHTFQLEALKTANLGVVVVLPGNSTLTVRLGA